FCWQPARSCCGVRSVRPSAWRRCDRWSKPCAAMSQRGATCRAAPMPVLLSDRVRCRFCRASAPRRTQSKTWTLSSRPAISTWVRRLARPPTPPSCARATSIYWACACSIAARISQLQSSVTGCRSRIDRNRLLPAANPHQPTDNTITRSWFSRYAPVMQVWLNGQFVERDSAMVSIFDAGFQHGVGLFETMLARNGVVFRPGAHMERLVNSARQLLLSERLRIDPLIEALNLTVSRNKLKEARVRLTITGGNLNMLQTEGRSQVDPTIVIVAQPPTVYP